MSWLHEITTYFLGNTKYNLFTGSYCLDNLNVVNMVNGFDDFFSFVNDYAKAISSLIYYPMRIFKEENPKKLNAGSVFASQTDVTVYPLRTEYFYLFMGQIKCNKPFGNAFDFANYKGYTTIKVFLPYLGFIEIDPNECMDKWLQFRLTIDYSTGKGLYIIGITDEKITHDNTIPYASIVEDEDMRILSTHECIIGIQIPLGSSNASDVQRNIALTAISTAMSVASSTYRITQPPTVTQTIETRDWEIKSRLPYKGSRMRVSETGVETMKNTRTYNKPVNRLSPLESAVSGSLDALAMSKPFMTAEKTNNSMLNYTLTSEIKVIFYTPKFSILTEDYTKLYGKPLNAIRTLDVLSGYTEIVGVHIEGEDFEKITSNERGKLEEILADGIIL